MFRWNPVGIEVSESAPYFGGLFMRKLKTAPILDLHQRYDFRDVGLPLGRPRKYTLEDLFDLFLRHVNYLSTLPFCYQRPRQLPCPTSFSQSSSLSTFTPSSFAVASFDPAPGPATT